MTVPTDCIACDALPEPSVSVADTPETRTLGDVLWAVWACSCAPERAAAADIACAPR